MFVTQRQGAELLREHAYLTRRRATALLRAGLAGPPVRRGRALAYDMSAVRSLAAREGVDWPSLFAEVPQGILVHRLPDSIELDVAATWQARTARLATQRAMPPVTVCLLDAEARATNGTPWVATLCGYVVHVATVTRVGQDERGRTTLQLAPPGDWGRHLVGRLLVTSPGRPWIHIHPALTRWRTEPDALQQ